MMRRLIPIALVALSAAAGAAEQQPSAASPGNLLQILFGLTLVLGLFVGVAWFLKRVGIAKAQTGTSIKIVGGLNLGSRERILVVEVADQWIVVGITPGQINTLSTMPRQESIAPPETEAMTKNFPAWLKQTLEKRNAKQV